MSTHPWLLRRKIATLPGVAADPKLCLARTLEKSEHIESVVVLIKWKGSGQFAIDYSEQTMGDLNLAARYLDKIAENIFFGENYIQEADPDEAS